MAETRCVALRSGSARTATVPGRLQQHRDEDDQRQAGQQVAELELREPQEVQSDAEDHEPSQSRQVGVQPFREEGRHSGRQEGQPALIEGYRQDGEQDSRPEGAGQEDGGDAVHDALRDEQRGVVAQAVLDGSDDAHGADAEEQRRRDEPLREVAFRKVKPRLQSVAQAVQPFVQPKPVPDECTQDEARQDGDGVLHLQPHAHAEAEREDPEAVEDRVVQAFGDETSQGETQGAAESDGGDVEDRSPGGDPA